MYKYLTFGNTKSEELVLLIHGTGSSKEFGRVALSLDDKYKYISLSLPGHDSQEMAQINDLSDFVLFVYDFLKTQRYASLRIIGFSLGGLIATSLFSTYANELNIKKIVCWSTPFIPKNIHIELINLLVKLISLFANTLPDFIFRILNFIDIKFTKNEVNVVRKVSIKDLLKTIGIVMSVGINPIDSELVMYLYDKHDKLADTKNLKLVSNFRKATILSIPRSGHWGTRDGWAMALDEINKFLF